MPLIEPNEVVVIVLATFNGASFVGQMLDSLRRQTLTDWKLLIRDDGSTDGTDRIVEDFSARDQRATIVKDDFGRCGPGGNFAHLLAAGREMDASYVFFADQDDVWYPDKIEKQLGFIKATESALDRGSRVLVHSDLTVTDQDLQIVHPSLMRHSKLPYRQAREPYKTLLFQNYALGCASLLNRPLLDLVVPVPSFAMHDQWTAICAASAGHLNFLPDSTLLYRRHAGNFSGQGDCGVSYLQSLWKLMTGGYFNAQRAQYIDEVLRLAEALSERLEVREIENVTPVTTTLKRLSEVLRQPSVSPPQIYELRKLGLPTLGVFRNCLCILSIVLRNLKRSKSRQAGLA